MEFLVVVVVVVVVVVEIVVIVVVVVLHLTGGVNDSVEPYYMSKTAVLVAAGSIARKVLTRP